MNIEYVWIGNVFIWRLQSVCKSGLIILKWCIRYKNALS